MTTDNEGDNDDATDNGATPSGLYPIKGKISSISGRLAAGGEPGMTSIDHIAIDLPDGRTVEYRQPTSGVETTARIVAEIRAMSFLNPQTGHAVCPICLTQTTDMHAEHVPQTALGGVVMTSTCQPCNNLLGSRVEVDLQAWFDNELVDTRIEHDGDIPGRRKFPRTHLRMSPDGTDFVMWVDGPAPPDVDAIIESGAWQVEFKPPDFERAALGLLKHVYLAACLHLQRIPDTDDARTIRVELLRARDTPRREPIEPMTTRLLFHRGGSGRQGPPLGLVEITPPEPGSKPELYVSLAGVLLVSWPFDEAPPEAAAIGEKRAGALPTV